MRTVVRTSGFELRYLPYEWVHPDGNPHRPDICIDLPITVLWKEILKLVKHWESSGRAGETSRQMEEGAVRNFSTQGKVRTEIHVIWTDDALDRWTSGRYDTTFGRLVLWTDGRPDGMTRRPNGWQGTKFSDLQTVNNLLEALLNSGIPVKKYLYKEMILSNRMWPITN